MNINQSYPSTDGAISGDCDINHLYNMNRIRGSPRSISSAFANDALLISACTISSIVCLVLVVYFCWMRWLEYRDRNEDLGESQQRPKNDALSEAEEDKLRGEIRDILPKKKFLQSGDEEANDGIAIDVGRGCPICLEPFQDEDEICWSHNADCCHVFHTCCIVDWLVKNDLRPCPMCRSFFLIEKEEKC